MWFHLSNCLTTKISSDAKKWDFEISKMSLSWIEWRHILENTCNICKWKNWTSKESQIWILIFNEGFNLRRRSVGGGRKDQHLFLNKLRSTNAMIDSYGISQVCVESFLHLLQYLFWLRYLFKYSFLTSTSNILFLNFNEIFFKRLLNKCFSSCFLSAMQYFSNQVLSKLRYSALSNFGSILPSYFLSIFSTLGDLVEWLLIYK